MCSRICDVDDAIVISLAQSTSSTSHIYHSCRFIASATAISNIIYSNNKIPLHISFRLNWIFPDFFLSLLKFEAKIPIENTQNYLNSFLYIYYINAFNWVYNFTEFAFRYADFIGRIESLKLNRRKNDERITYVRVECNWIDLNWTLEFGSIVSILSICLHSMHVIVFLYDLVFDNKNSHLDKSTSLFLCSILLLLLLCTNQALLRSTIYLCLS